MIKVMFRVVGAGTVLMIAPMPVVPLVDELVMINKEKYIVMRRDWEVGSHYTDPSNEEIVMGVCLWVECAG